MISTREAIYTALFTKLQAISGIATCTRRLKAVSALSGAQMPAIYLHEDAERVPEVKRGLPSKWHLLTHIYVYVEVGGDHSIAPGTVMNPILDAIDQILMPGPPQNEQTLGGLVQWCRIFPEIVKHEPEDSDQMIALVPVEMLTT